MKKFIKAFTMLALAFMIIGFIGNVSAEAKVKTAKFSIKDGDFVYGQSTARVTFKVNKTANVTIKVYNSNDKVVFTQIFEKCEAGKYYYFNWDGKDAASDDYYVIVTAGKSSKKSGTVYLYKTTGFKKGSGSKKNPYIVSTPKEFMNVARFNGRYFKQSKDIDFSSETFVPLFTAEEPFNGVYNGNGKTIKNITYTGGSDNTGFFRCVGTKGVITKLNFKDCVFSANKRGGIIVGQNEGEISNCSVTDCSIVATENSTGSIAGWNNGKIISCTVKDNLIKNGYYGGGVVGFNESNGYIKDCTTENNTISGSQNSHGGIVGKNLGNIASCIAKENTISNTGTGYYHDDHQVGGITGYNSGIVSKCEVSNLKDLISHSQKYAGNIVGLNSNGGVETGNVYYGEPV